ncbi:LamG-like jellyroll fold domain-containing protein [uncultured Algibacter sp.]|uniref:LamG-like jellyroll fold domain-containing protein n=1 Tax=uncultured Algibacter sp. TaxID=298659 RepID=UPI00260AFFB1|nr:LamG-like jellyroll fold domain-containing protein [uncultured Algibacter sp.]
MKQIAIKLMIVSSLVFCNTKIHGQLHQTPTCGQNFNLKWSTSTVSDDQYWPPGELSNTYTNVDNSGTDITVTFTGETSTLGFWAGQTPKVGTQSSYLYKGLDLLSNGFSGTGITCTITFSKPIYAFSFDIHHINVHNGSGDKYTITGKDKYGNIIYPEFTNSTAPTYTSNNETGEVNAIANLTSGTNTIVGVNFADSNHIQSVSFLWEDCDTCNNNSPHATGIGDFSFCTPQTIDFDGVDDYVNTDPFLGGQNEITMMSWIKLDQGFDGGDIMGQKNFRLFIDSDNKLNAFIKPNIGAAIETPKLIEHTLNEDIWYHTALKYNNTTGFITLYLNGKEIWNYSDSELIGNTIINTEEWNLGHDFEIGRNSGSKDNYFEGSIYECRVYNKALSQIQLQQQINQEIENNNGQIRGLIIPRDIDGLLWSDLLLYFKMKNGDSGFVQNESNLNFTGKLNNMSILQKNQDYTAPLPYVTKKACNGNWHDSTNWLHGNNWDLNNTTGYSIIQINGNLEISTDLNTAGLIIDPGSTLKIYKNSQIINSWYLKLDGTLNLKKDSQLIQSENSILDKTSSGTLVKDLKGTADKYTYNYWSSPVGKTNNTTTNNNYTVKDIFTNVKFISTGYDGVSNPLSIADYWIWKFNNRLSDNYSSWQHIRSSGEIFPGEGFTMKGPGTGTVGEEQDYTFEGKPNNGDISLTVYEGNDYLIGNPYPSAIDAVKFIQDNKSTIDGEGAINGTLYFWKHWGGASHLASEYQGGYATFSLCGGIPAISKNTDTGIISTSGSSKDVPGRYIPVGQGFYTTADTNGTIIFNNGQRVYHVEESNTPAYKTNNDKKSSNENDVREKLRIGFKSVNNLHRQLLITADENATIDYDWGYDSKYIDTQIDDMYWLINNEKHTIQGINEINKKTILPLGIHTKTDGLNSINIDELENTPNDIEIYLHDKGLGIYHNLRESKYETYLPTGQYLNRFEITFSKANTLSAEENNNNQIEVYFSNEKNSIVVNNPASKHIETIEMFNILGQTLFKFNINTNNNHIEYNSSQIKTGNYILKIETEFGVVSKKVLIN